MKKEHVLNRTRYQDLFPCKQCDEKSIGPARYVCRCEMKHFPKSLKQKVGGGYRATGESQCRY